MKGYYAAATAVAAAISPRLPVSNHSEMGQNTFNPYQPKYKFDCSRQHRSAPTTVQSTAHSGCSRVRLRDQAMTKRNPTGRSNDRPESKSSGTDCESNYVVGADKRIPDDAEAREVIPSEVDDRLRDQGAVDGNGGDA